MDNRIEEMANDLQEAWTAWSLSKDLKNPYAFVAEILAKKWRPKIPENAVVLTREEYDKLLDANFGVMTSPIGDLEINPKGMHKAVDEIVRLNRVESELQHLNAKYYNEAKDLRRNMAKIRANAYSKEELEYKIQKASKETAEKFAERVKMAFYYEFDELIPSIMADKIDEIAKEITEGEV